MEVDTGTSLTGVARWSRFAALGFAFAAAAPALMLIGAAAFGMDLNDGLFFVIPMVVLGVTSFLVRRYGTWAKILGIVLGLLAGLMFFWLIFGLFVPASFFDFVPSVLFMPGIFMGIGGSIAALVAGRRGHRSARAEAGEATGIRIAVGTVAVLTVLSAVMAVAGRSTADPAGTAAQIALADFEFMPKTVTVPGGSTIYLENDDAFFHTFTIDELDIAETFIAGSSATVTIPTQPGTYVFYCEPHSDADSPDPGPDSDDMAGTLTVT